MKNLVCILGGYAPFFAPGGVIADNILKELENEYHITIIAQRNDFSLAKHDEINGIRVIRLNDWNRMIYSLCERKLRTVRNPFAKAFYKLLLYAKKAVYFAVTVFQRHSISRPYVRAVLRELEELDRNEGIDIIVPVSSPHEAIVAATEFHKSHCDIPFFPYKLDEFANNKNLYPVKAFSKAKYRRNLALETETLKGCAALFALPPIAAYYEKSGDFGKLTDKVIRTEHPLVIKQELPAAKKNDVTSLVYAGSLDMGFRNPDKMLEAFSQLGKTDRFVFRLFSFGNCQSVIDRYKLAMPDSLYDGGKIAFSRVSEEIAAADMLVSIGNDSETQVPSKLFTYLSYGKPIIHFYFRDTDAYISYLSKYEASLCLKISEPEKNAEKISAFLKKYSRWQTDFGTVEKIYRECTPAYTAELFRQEFNKK